LRHGLYLAELARRGHAGPILGADMSPGMLRAARQRAEDAGPAGPALLVADATALPLRDAAADLTLVDLDQGETLLRSAFTSVTRHDFVSKLLLPGPEPVVDYVRSMSEAKYAVAPELLIPAVTDRLPGRCEGAVFEVTTHSGCLVCA
jgi:SAM-dependent methyltransferase